MTKEKVRKTFTFDGKRYTVRGDTEVDAEVKKALKIKELEEGRIVLSGDMTLNDWAEECIATYKTGVADITLRKYKNRINCCILKYIGDKKLKTIKPLQLQQVLNNQQGKSKCQIKETHQALKLLFSKAKANHLIPSDPSIDLVEPAGTKTYRRALSEYEEEIFVKSASSDSHFMVFLLMYYCGCRPSEAQEAQGRDLMIVEGYPILHIRGTKTKAADRQVPIPRELYELIKDTPPFDYIAPNMAGNKHTEKSYQRAWKNLKREMNIEMGCKVYRNELIPPFPLAVDLVPYCLRHTYCTNLQKKDVDLRTAQYLMGHTDIKMTANIYTHADTSTILKAAEKIV